MFIRRRRKTNAAGERVTYLSLAHNVRERLPSGKTRPRPVIFARLGREDALDRKRVREARDLLDQLLKDKFGDEPPAREAVDAVAQQTRAKAPQLRVLTSRAHGMRVIVESVWNRLGLRRALRAIDKDHATRFDLERMVFAMVLNRIVDPVSKRACNTWVRDEAWLPELADVDVQHFYRALDLMDAHTDDILEAVGQAAREGVADDDLATLLLDTTSSYTESQFDDLERQQIQAEWDAFDAGEGDEPSAPRPQVINEPPLRMRGHSKDHRPREPQVKLGLLRTHDGRPVDMQVCAGHVHDQQLTLDLIRAARARMRDQRLIVVMDSGMGGNPNLKAIDGLDGEIHRVSAVPLRRSKVAEQALLAHPGRWRKHPYKDGFVYRDAVLDEKTSPSGRRERWVATRNESEARRQRRLLDKEIERIKAALAQDDRIDGHGRPVCKLLANPKRRRFLRPDARGRRYLLDQEVIRVERRRAGVHVVRSTLVDEPAAATLRAYDAQYAIEGDFRTLKTPLKLRPMHHRASRRIKAHMLMCGLALMVVRELERRSGETLKTLRQVFGGVRAVQMQQGSTRFWQREEWSPRASALLKALDIDQGPTTWGAEHTPG